MATPIERFRRAMRRHERRAKRMGYKGTAHHMRIVRLDPNADELRPESESAEEFLRGMASGLRDGFHDSNIARRAAFLHERAADAVARLRAESTKA